MAVGESQLAWRNGEKRIGIVISANGAAGVAGEAESVWRRRMASVSEAMLKCNQ